MTLTSFSFFYFVLAAFAVFVWVSPQKRWILLLATSCAIYFFFSKWALVLASLQTLLAFFMGLSLEKWKSRKLLIVFSLIQLSPLFGLKYLEPIPKQGLWIVGLSFYTFQILSYLIDIYRNQQKAETHLGHFALYILFFANKLAGPIERPGFLQQTRQIHLSENLWGFAFLIWLGLFKKLVLADHLSFYIDPVFQRASDFSGVPVVVAILLSKYQIYCDFSGYSDIALGLAGFFGLRLTENFNRPFATTNIRSYWQRWHISLQTWIRDYVFYPLVSSPLARWGLYPLTVLTFLVFAIWHDARWTFVVYGILQGTLVYFSQTKAPLAPNKSAMRMICKFLFTYVFLISLPGVLFRAETWQQVEEVFSNFSFQLRNWKDYSQLHNQSLWSLLAFIFIFELGLVLESRFSLRDKWLKSSFVLKLTAALLLILTLALTANLDQEIGFIYSRF